MENVAAVVTGLALAGAACGRPQAPERKATVVLFVGDSLSAQNDLPGVFSRIAASRGDLADVVAHLPGGSGSTSQAALNDRDFMNSVLPSRDWNYVVVQEHSEIPALTVPPEDHDLAPSLRALVENIRIDAPDASPVFMATWGFKNGDQNNCAYDPHLCNYDDMQDALMKAYESYARDYSGILAPVGLAWRLVRRKTPWVELYGDDHHPSASGTYLSACVLYSILFRKHSRGAGPQGLPPDVAAILQDAADSVVFGSGDDWYRTAVSCAAAANPIYKPDLDSHGG